MAKVKKGQCGMKLTDQSFASVKLIPHKCSYELL